MPAVGGDGVRVVLLEVEAPIRRARAVGPAVLRVGGRREGAGQQEQDRQNRPGAVHEHLAVLAFRVADGSPAATYDGGRGGHEDRSEYIRPGGARSRKRPDQRSSSTKRSSERNGRSETRWEVRKARRRARWSDQSPG